MHDMICKSLGILLAAAVAVTGLAQEEAEPAAEGSPPDGAVSLESIIDTSEDILDADIQEVDKGDLQEFRIVTDDDISELEVGDIYKNNAGFYKVIDIAGKGEKGGKFVVQRTSGENEPTRTWTRVSGFGPISVVSRETLLSRFVSGGPLMYPIAILLLAMLVIAANNGVMYRREKQCPSGFVTSARAAIEAGDVKRLGDEAGAVRGLLPAMCLAMVRHYDISTEDDIRVRCESEARRQVSILRIPLRALNFIAVAAPLLGLLGTVTGMIACFDSLAEQAASAGKSQAMAAGIKVALLTTAFGLSTAVPTLLVYFIYNQKLANVLAYCEMYATEFIHRLGLLKRKSPQA